jgi:hypothetical protein
MSRIRDIANLFSASTDMATDAEVLAAINAAKISATTVSSNITLSKDIYYMVNTSAARSLALPATPSVGDRVYIFDQTGSSASNNITVTPNGSNLNGSSQNLVIDLNYATAVLQYISSAYGWRVYIA